MSSRQLVAALGTIVVVALAAGLIAGGTVAGASRTRCGFAYGACPPPDRTPPGVSVRAPAAFSIRSLIAHGLRVRVGCTEPCAIVVLLLLRHGTAHHLGLAAAPDVRIGAGSGGLDRAGDTIVTVKLSRRAARRLRGRQRVRATLRTTATDRSGNRTQTRKPIRLSR